MLDKEKLLDFLKSKHDAYSSRNKEEKDELLSGLIIEYSLLWSIISIGKFDIEKQTCKWNQIETYLEIINFVKDALKK